MSYSSSRKFVVEIDRRKEVWEHTDFRYEPNAFAMFRISIRGEEGDLAGNAVGADFAPTQDFFNNICGCNGARLTLQLKAQGLAYVFAEHSSRDCTVIDTIRERLEVALNNPAVIVDYQHHPVVPTFV